MSATKELELRACAASWEPSARLLGNVTALEIIQVCDTLTEARNYWAEETNERQRLEFDVAQLRADLERVTKERDALRSEILECKPAIEGYASVLAEFATERAAHEATKAHLVMALQMRDTALRELAETRAALEQQERGYMQLQRLADDKARALTETRAELELEKRAHEHNWQRKARALDELAETRAALERPRPWRCGRQVPRNIYDAQDEPIAMLPDEATARLIVDAVNARDEADQERKEQCNG